MIATTTDITKYIHHVNTSKFSINDDPKNMLTLTLFGNTVPMHNDAWKRHIHLKITNTCNAKCSFCSEADTANISYSNVNEYIATTTLLLDQLKAQDAVKTISITGGEPLTWSKENLTTLVNLCMEYNPTFTNLNTNGYKLAEYIDIFKDFNFINISRHRLTNEENLQVFKVPLPTVSELKQLHSIMKPKLRIQCVIDETFTEDYFYAFIDTYSFADDISFRRLIDGTKNEKEVYNHLLSLIVNDPNYTFIEQAVQDYYTYETWQHLTGQLLQFSYSDMKLLRAHEDTGAKVFQELIVHPNSTISGSWDNNKKVIYQQRMKDKK